MAEVIVCKAFPNGPDAPTPDAHIHITGTVPDDEYSSLERWAAYWDEQAGQIHEALIHSLPGGVYDRLLGRMLARKASHFRVAHEVVQPAEPDLLTACKAVLAYYQHPTMGGKSKMLKAVKEAVAKAEGK